MLKKKEKDLEEEKKKKRISFFVWKRNQEKKQIPTSNTKIETKNNIFKKIENTKIKKTENIEIKKADKKQNINFPVNLIKEKKVNKDEKQLSPKKTSYTPVFTKPKKEHPHKEKSKNTQTPVSKTNHLKPQKKDNQLLELAINNELDTILNNKKYELNKLTIEYDILKKQTENIVKTEDLEEKEKEIKQLLIKLDEIKRQLELIINSSTFKNIYKLENRYLTNLIDEYKQSLKDNSILLEKVNSLENSNLCLTIFNELIELEKEEKKLQKELAERKKEYEIRDDTFEEWKDNYLDIENVNKSLDDLVKESENYLKDIEKKVAQAVTVTEITETKIKSSIGIIGQMLLLTVLLKNNPTKKANGIVALETLLTLNIINEILKPKEVTEKHFISDIIDYKNLITNALDDVENVNNLITHSLSTITELKDSYQKEFKQYQSEIPEYQKLLDQLETIEKEMLTRQDNMHKITNELSYQYDKNNQKVKKYQNLS